MAVESAPGRVNLIGEHTDYNDGFVLPTVIPLRVHVALEPRDGGEARIVSEGFGAIVYALGDERREGDWADHARGVTSALRGAGQEVGGFWARVTTDLPAGAGLGSSAAFTVALIRALRAAFGLTLDDRALAALAHSSETEFVGARVGTMDQLASSLGRPGEALFIDTRSGDVRPISLPRELAIVVVDSGQRHRHAGGAYNTRRDECEEAARIMGVRALRDATDEMVTALAREHPVLARRARHVVSENDRVRMFADALRAGELGICGQILDASHHSLRQRFEVSTPEIDALADLLRAQPGVYGARIVGGGFGGSVIALAAPSSAAQAGRAASAAFRKQSGLDARSLLS